MTNNTDAPRVCYHAGESYTNALGNFLVIKITEDEAGYDMNSWADTLELAKRTAQRLNDVMGLTADDVLDIRASSMAAGKVDVDRVGDLTALRATLTEARAELEEFKRKVRTVATTYAKEHNWCGIVSEALEELGLPGIPREFTVTVSVRGTVDVLVTAASESAAGVEAQRLVDNGTGRIAGYTIEHVETDVDDVEAR